MQVFANEGILELDHSGSTSIVSGAPVDRFCHGKFQRSLGEGIVIVGIVGILEILEEDTQPNNRKRTST